MFLQNVFRSTAISVEIHSESKRTNQFDMIAFYFPCAGCRYSSSMPPLRSRRKHGRCKCKYVVWYLIHKYTYPHHINMQPFYQNELVTECTPIRIWIICPNSFFYFQVEFEFACISQQRSLDVDDFWPIYICIHRASDAIQFLSTPWLNLQIEPFHFRLTVETAGNIFNFTIMISVNLKYGSVTVQQLTFQLIFARNSMLLMAQMANYTKSELASLNLDKMAIPKLDYSLALVSDSILCHRS